MILKFDELSYGYEKNLFSNVSGAVTSGQVLNILGINGVGKTTLAKCFLNIIRKYEGEILCDDINIKSLSIKERSKKVGYIGVGEPVPMHLSVFEYVLLGCASELGLFRMPKQKETEKVMKILSNMECAHLATKKMFQLSQGEKQIVSVSRILVQNPDVIIFDEPTVSLDMGNQRRLLELMMSLIDSGHIVINITHDPNHAFFLGGYALLLSKDGHKFGEVDAVMTSANLSDLYGVNVKVLEDESFGKIAVGLK